MDPRGNRLAMFHNGVQTPYTYGDNNELTDAGGTGWDYDHFGNTVSMGAYDLTYDFESHVLTISAIVGASDIHEYDGDGRRMRSKLNGSSVWNHFVHDELTENILIEYQVPVNPNAKSLYTWGIGLISSTQVAVSEKRWFHFDGLGTTAALTDFNENITDTYEFSAFGVLEGSTGSSVNPYRYVGQWGYYDDGARSSQYGLLLLGVRYYERNVGRFLTWDEISSINRYTYVRNAATAAIDPSGMLVEICVRELSLPFTEALGRAHWFFNTSKCGARGYESAGLMTGWKANAGGHAVNCVRIHVTAQEEECICKEAKSVWAGGGSWFGGGPFGDPTLGEYHWKHHNCQDFVQTILYKCLGGVLDWPEMGACPAPRGAPRFKVPRPRVPTSCHPAPSGGTFGYG